MRPRQYPPPKRAPYRNAVAPRQDRCRSLCQGSLPRPGPVGPRLRRAGRVAGPDRAAARDPHVPSRPPRRPACRPLRHLPERVRRNVPSDSRTRPRAVRRAAVGGVVRRAGRKGPRRGRHLRRRLARQLRRGVPHPPGVWHPGHHLHHHRQDRQRRAVLAAGPRPDVPRRRRLPRRPGGARSAGGPSGQQRPAADTRAVPRHGGPLEAASPDRVLRPAPARRLDRRKRGQVQFAGTARRVLRTNWTCPLFRRPPIPQCRGNPPDGRGRHRLRVAFRHASHSAPLPPPGNRVRVAGEPGGARKPIGPHDRHAGLPRRPILR